VTEFITHDQAAPSCDLASEDLTDVATSLRKAKVTALLLVHGTFVGNDVIGLGRELARLSPKLASKLTELGKVWLDQRVGEVGNYAESYVAHLSKLINSPGLSPVQVQRLNWSGENHHLGRADGAMLLAKELTSLVSADGRVLVLTHSHGGNLVAMLSLLAGCDSATRSAFFELTRLHYCDPIRRRVDLPLWPEAQAVFEQSLPPIDVATFGMPLRYRWCMQTCRRLLHFVHHRPLADERALPVSINELLTGAAGDYVQQLGIAGTDFLPPIFAWRDWIVEQRMQRMFEPGSRRRDLLKNVKLGRRVSAEGTTLLIDYPDDAGHMNQKLLGHGVYTCSEWLPFHLREICKRFYT
jgi:hypothetical protein